MFLKISRHTHMQLIKKCLINLILKLAYHFNYYDVLNRRYTGLNQPMRM